MSNCSPSCPQVDRAQEAYPSSPNQSASEVECILAKHGWRCREEDVAVILEARSAAIQGDYLPGEIESDYLLTCHQGSKGGQGIMMSYGTF